MSNGSEGKGSSPVDCSVAPLIFFIHHIALSIQASTILASVARETIITVEAMFPAGASAATCAQCDPDGRLPVPWGPAVLASECGYLRSIDEAALLEFASGHATVIRMARGVGLFVVQLTALMTLALGSHDGQAEAEELREMVKISVYRTIEQDPVFGIRQIVDVALKALSPASTTPPRQRALITPAPISPIVAPKTFPPLCLYKGDRRRVLTIGPACATLVRAAGDQIRRGSGRNVAMIDRMGNIILVIGSLARAPERLRALTGQLDLLDELRSQIVASPAERVAVRGRIAAVRSQLAHRATSGAA